MNNFRSSYKLKKVFFDEFELKDFPFTVKSNNKEVYFYVYVIKNLKEDLFYIGSHKAKNLYDGYSGSSINLNKDYKRLGIENFKKIILKFFKSSKEMLEFEQNLIRQNISNHKCYNLAITPESNSIGMVIVTDNNGNFYQVKKDDPRIGKTFFYMSENKVSVVDKNGNTFQTDINDPRYLSGELVAPNKGQVTIFKNNRWQNISTEEYHSSDKKYLTTSAGKIVVKIKGDSSNEYFLISSEEFKNNKVLYETPSSNLILCCHKITKQFKSIKREDLHLYPDYVSYSSMSALVKDNNGNIFRCFLDDPLYKKEYFPLQCGKLVAKDKNGNMFYADVDDPRLSTGEIEFFRKGKVSVKDKDGNYFEVATNDPRYLSGELLFFRTGYKWMNKDGKSIQVPEDKVLEYENKGWVLGQGFGPKHWINKDGKSIVVYESEMEKYLKDGWKEGTKTDFRWVSKEKKKMMVHISELQKYLDEGWKLGYSTGKCWVNKNKTSKRIPIEELQEYLDNGWKKGLDTDTKLMNNGIDCKQVKSKDFQEYLDNGWAFGGINNYRFINKDGYYQYIIKEEAEKLIKFEGWQRGKGANTSRLPGTKPKKKEVN